VADDVEADDVADDVEANDVEFCGVGVFDFVAMVADD